MDTYTVLAHVNLPDLPAGEVAVVARSARWDGLETAGKVTVLREVTATAVGDPFGVTVTEVDVDAEAVPEGATIAEVLGWVGDDPDRAREAIAVERSGKDRTSLLETLLKIAG